MIHAKELALLKDFGFTPLQANLYLALMAEPGSTGYHLAHEVGSPTANVYKALTEMAGRGLVTADESGRAKQYSPVPFSEFFIQYEASLRRKSRQLERALEDITPKEPIAQIHKLQSFDQTLSRAITIIREAKATLVVDAFPEVLDRLRSHLESRAGEGVKILVHTYEPYSLAGCRVIVPRSDSALWKRVPERAFDIAADGEQFIIANFTLDYTTVLEAPYSNHIYLSLMIYASLTRGMLVYDLEEAEGYPEEVRAGFSSFLRSWEPFLLSGLPGMREFFERHGGLNPPTDTVQGS